MMFVLPPKSKHLFSDCRFSDLNFRLVFWNCHRRHENATEIVPLGALLRGVEDGHLWCCPKGLEITRKMAHPIRFELVTPAFGEWVSGATILCSIPR